MSTNNTKPTFGIFTHVKPDADAFGTAITVAIALKVKAWFHADDWDNRPATIRAVEAKYPNVAAFTATFGGYYDDDREVPAVHDNIVVDCGDPSRISAPDAVKAGAGPFFLAIRG